MQQVTQHNLRMERFIASSNILKRINFNLFGKQFKISIDLDKKYGGRYYIQASYFDVCRETGVDKEWFGRKWYLSDHMTDDEVVKTAFAACKAAVDHEVMEAFTVDGIVLFNPHIDYLTLLSVSHNEVRRAPHG